MEKTDADNAATIESLRIDLANERERHNYDNFKHSQENECLRGQIADLREKLIEAQDINDFLDKQLQKHWRELSRVEKENEVLRFKIEKN